MCAREVMKETHVQVKNMRYVTSQPWPFSHSLMLTFIADYDWGDIQHDSRELFDAGWYRYDVLPLLLPFGTWRAG